MQMKLLNHDSDLEDNLSVMRVNFEPLHNCSSKSMMHDAHMG